MNKIEIKSSSDNLRRISVFLDNNHIRHDLITDFNDCQELEEMAESIEWPL